MDTSRRIIKIICELLHLSEDAISYETLLTDDLGADSVDLAELAIMLEEEFGIDIPDSVIDGFLTVGDIINYIGSRIMRLP